MVAKKAKEESLQEGGPDILSGQKCPMCFKDTLTLMEHARDVPYFGPVVLFSMDCSGCNYHKADVECMEEHEGAKYTLTVENDEDLKARVVKSSTAVVKIPRVMIIDPGPASNGYVTNVEGILNRVKVMLEKTRDTEEDKTKRKKAKTLLKKVQNALWGHDPIDVIIEDPKGNSAILSEKAKKDTIKKRK
jgi:zinc finger protein